MKRLIVVLLNSIAISFIHSWQKKIKLSFLRKYKLKYPFIECYASISCFSTVTSWFNVLVSSLHLSYSVRPPKAKPKTILQCNCGGINLEVLLYNTREADWSGVYNAATVDGKVDVFNNVKIQLYDQHAPLCRIKIKHFRAWDCLEKIDF